VGIAIFWSARLCGLFKTLKRRDRREGLTGRVPAAG
jgi:hypothetical protein